MDFALVLGLLVPVLSAVQDPPGPPILRIDGALPMVAGGQGQLRITCMSEGGNPIPGITIYKGGEKLSSKVQSERGITTAMVKTAVITSDNGAQITCEVINSAIAKPLLSHTEIELLFPPKEIRAWVLPDEPVDAGQVVKLICESSSSHPPSHVRWYSRNQTFHNAKPSHLPGMFGGVITRSELEIRALVEDNRRSFTCEADNNLSLPVTANVTLNILHGPIWTETPEAKVEVIEKEDLALKVATLANPHPVTYTWWRGPLKVETLTSGKTREDANNDEVIEEENTLDQEAEDDEAEEDKEEEKDEDEAEEAILLMKRVHRQDAGSYSVTATNTKGTVNASFIIDVLYGPENILSAERVTVDEGGSAAVVCSAVGNPTPNITWFRQEDNSSARQELSWGVRESELIISDALREETDFYWCSASNVVASPPPVATAVIVAQAPEPVEGEAKRPWASVGGVGRLECRAKAAPMPNFRWSLGEDRVLYNNRKYFVRIPQLVDGLLEWSSILEIRKVDEEDYATYTCTATNSRGSFADNYSLGPPVPPNEPTHLNVTSVTGSTAFLSWIPPAIGVSPEGYILRYRSLQGEEYQTIEITEKGSTTTEVKGLMPGIEYEFTIQSYTEEGHSPYSFPSIQVVMPEAGTLAELEENSSLGYYPRYPRLILLLMSLAGLLLLILNISIIICIFRRFAADQSFTVSHKAASDTCRPLEAMETDLTAEEMAGNGSLEGVCQSSKERARRGESLLVIHQHTTEITEFHEHKDDQIGPVSFWGQLVSITSQGTIYPSTMMNGSLDFPGAETSSPESEVMRGTDEKICDDVSKHTMMLSSSDIPDVCPKSPSASRDSPYQYADRDAMAMYPQDDRFSVVSDQSCSQNTNQHELKKVDEKSSLVNLHDQDNSSPKVNSSIGLLPPLKVSPRTSDTESNSECLSLPPDLVEPEEPYFSTQCSSQSLSHPKTDMLYEKIHQQNNMNLRCPHHAGWQRYLPRQNSSSPTHIQTHHTSDERKQNQGVFTDQHEDQYPLHQLVMKPRMDQNTNNLQSIGDYKVTDTTVPSESDQKSLYHQSSTDFRDGHRLHFEDAKQLNQDHQQVTYPLCLTETDLRKCPLHHQQQHHHHHYHLRHHHHLQPHDEQRQVNHQHLALSRIPSGINYNANVNSQPSDAKSHDHHSLALDTTQTKKHHHSHLSEPTLNFSSQNPRHLIGEHQSRKNNVGSSRHLCSVNLSERMTNYSLDKDEAEKL